MSSERRKGHRKLSGGILKSRVHDSEDNLRESHGVKIYIKRNDDDDTLPSDVDEERFEQLKASYHKQCQPINMNLIRKLTDKRSTSDYNNFSRSNCVVSPQNRRSDTLEAEKIEKSSHLRGQDVAKRATHESRNTREKEPSRSRDHYHRHH